jgi:predicted permease
MKSLWNLLRLRRLHEDAAGEIESHIEEKTAELVDAGLPEPEARARARREFGNVALTVETSRAVWGWTWLERLAQDLRYGVRMLARTPGFTAVAILSLALGIGANTAIFGLLDVILFRMLPVERPEELRLVGVRWTPEAEKPTLAFSYPCFRLMRDSNQSFRELAASATFQWRDKSVSGDGAWHNGQMVSGNYFPVLGVGAALGRVLGPADDVVEGTGRPDGIPAVLNYAYWRRALGSDPGVLGRQINLNGAWATVVGVASPEFFGTIVGASPDVFVPVLAQPSVSPPDNLLHEKPGGGSSTWIIAFGRLKPGVPEAQAQAELTVAAHQYRRTRLSPADRDKPVLSRVVLEPGSRGLSRLRDRFSEPLTIVMALVGAVLLIACANLANLMLARTAARRREIAIRLAIGAPRSRIVRQLLTESVLLAVLGGAIGLAFALWSGGLLVRMLPAAPVPFTVNLAPDARLLAFTFGLATLTGLLFGVAPAIRETRTSLNESLQRTRRFDLSRALVVVQIALAAPLVVGAGLFIGTLRNLVTQDAGFLRENVIQLRILPDVTGIPRPQWSSLYEQVLERVKAVPGVRAATLANRGLMEEGTTATGPIHVPGYTFAAGERKALPETYVSLDYFEASGIPLRMGRLFTPAEAEGKTHVAVVNETMARRYYPGRNPVGLTYDLGSNPATRLEIVGVVADARYNDLRNETVPMAYYPWRQVGTPRMSSIMVRTRGDAAAIAPALRQAIASIHPDLFFQSRTLADQIDESLVRERMLARLSGFLGLLALVVACVGLYGVLSYGVTRRASEIGVRVALGASPSSVAGMVLRQTAGLIAMGVGAGIGLSLALTRLTATFLYGVKPNEPAVLAAAAFAMATVGLLAAYLPARRASRVDPLVALRHE